MSRYVPSRHSGKVENPGAGWGWVVNVTPRPLYPRERNPVPIVQEDGWTSGSVWISPKNLDPTGYGASDWPVRSESLYRQSYRGPLVNSMYETLLRIIDVLFDVLDHVMIRYSACAMCWRKHRNVMLQCFGYL
jgi:hypothetical protein